MTNEIEYVRAFGEDVPAASEATKRRIHAFASDTARRGRAWIPAWLGGIVYSLSRHFAPAPRRSRVTRVVVALVAIVLTGVGAAVAMTSAASGGQGISDLLAQVRTSLGDGRLLSASVRGSTLVVQVTARDEPSAVSASFEGQMLAAAVRDSQSAEGGASIDSVQFADASGATMDIGVFPVGERKFAALTDGACDSAAQAARRTFESRPGKPSLTVESVVTLPYGGGSCVFKFQTSDPEAFAESASSVIPPLDEAMGAPNQRSFLLEVDDQAGTPQYVQSYTWSGGAARGATYIKPGLSTASVSVPAGLGAAEANSGKGNHRPR